VERPAGERSLVEVRSEGVITTIDWTLARRLLRLKDAHRGGGPLARARLAPRTAGRIVEKPYSRKGPYLDNSLQVIVIANKCSRGPHIAQWHRVSRTNNKIRGYP